MQTHCEILKACQLACVAILITATAGEAATIAADATAVNGSSSRAQVVVSCGERQECPWNTPPILSTGCCPKEAGQSCSPVRQEFCNHEFGFFCADQETGVFTEDVGVCRGKYNLTATSVEAKQVSFEWRAFAPPDYRFEYVIMYKKVPYHRDISHWKLIDCGVEPQCLMRRLTPSTTYLIKMAIWKDIRSNTLGNTTETIVVTTKAVEQCEHEDTIYTVGETFVHGQEEKCTCLQSGDFHCDPLCPNGIPHLEEGCRMVLGEECQYNITCNVKEGFQKSDEEHLCIRHRGGTEFRLDCRVCTCVEEKLKCSYSEVCNMASHPKPSCKHIKEIKIPGQCCPEWECEDVCEHENQSYSAGELFFSHSCGMCQCQPSGKVECMSNCPPVEMVPPSPGCPNPQVKFSGCCHTLHCSIDDSDLFSYVPNIDVLYTTATSVTLGFDVEPVCEFNGSPGYCNYRIQYANTSSHQETASWTNRVVHPVDIVNDGIYNVTHPNALLTRATAVVIEGKAVITLSGMHPGTEFYVVVVQEEVEGREDMAQEGDNSVIVGKRGLAAKVVVKTRPLQNATSCFYAGKEVLHGQMLHRSCSQECVCSLGQVECRSTCTDEHVVIASSLSCPQPRLQRLPGDCCPKWQCYPTVSGCRYNNALLRSGQVISDGCQECVCRNSSVQCVSLCPPIGHSPRAGCTLTNQTDHCRCPQWSCPLETSPPTAVEISVLLNFSGSCQPPFTDFKRNLARKVLIHVTSYMECAGSPKEGAVCEGVSADVDCNLGHSQPGDRKRRSIEIIGGHFIKVLLSVRRNYSSERDHTLVSRAGRRLQEAFNTSVTVRMSSGVSLRTLAAPRLNKPVYICPRGFYYQHGQCVLSEIDIMGSQWTQLELFPEDVTSHAVTFQWAPLGENLQHFIKSLQIKYRIHGTVKWSSTKLMSPRKTSITVSDLRAGTPYEATLIAFAQDNHEDKWVLGEGSFESEPLPEQVASFHLKEVSVTDSCITLYWGHLSDDFWNQTETVSILYWVSSSNQVHKQKIMSREFPFMTIKELSSSTEYTVQMTALIVNGKTVRSQELRLSTFSSEKCDDSFFVPVIISCVGIMAVALVVLLSAFLCRRWHRKEN